MVVSAGFGALALLFLFLSIVMAGFASGLSLFLPRIGSWLAIATSVPFVASGLYSGLQDGSTDAVVWVGPGCIVIGSSVFMLLQTVRSWWEGSTVVRIIGVVLATVPALMALYILGFLIFSLGILRSLATTT